ncbi:MAG: Ig-like domain-containing protein [Acidithiobacillus sp.]|jgi:hypothetical protein|uniref:Ig-like domain-containing protein n=1 Tax=Acidithiobacillus sp. TaxID=1872118 RepID=UPI0035607E28
MGTPSKIHVGAGNLVLNPDTSPIDLGFCSDGLTLTYNAALEPIEIDQILAPVGYFVPGEECKVETVLSELSAEKFAYAIGKAAADVADVEATADVKGTSTIKFGGNTVLTDYVLEYSAPKRDNRDLYLRVRLLKINISPEIETAFTKDGKSGIKLVAMAVADTTQPAGEQLGWFREETAEVTGTTATLAVSTTDPADADADVAITESILVNFNRSIHPESVHSGNFILIKDDGTHIACTVTQSGAAQATVNPDASLANSSDYILAVAKDVRALDDYSSMAANHIINFTTVAP